MSVLKPAIEYIEFEEHSTGEVSDGQKTTILSQFALADILFCLPWESSYLVRERVEKRLIQEYLCWLKPWDEVEIWLERMMPYHTWVVISNEWDIIKVKGSCYGNKKRKEWIRSFSTINWYSKGFLFLDDYGSLEKTYYYLVLPSSYRKYPIIETSYELIQELDARNI